MKVIVALISAVILLCSKSEGCATSADCGDDECCVSIIRPLGRRQVSDDLTACRPIGTEGADCLLGDSVFSKNEWYFACPCKVGLTCIGNGVFDPPLGETGTCHHH